MPALLTFMLGAIFVILAGVWLTRHSETIAERTTLGGAWTGAILLAAATSLPELTTDVYAVRAGNVSLAVAELFGSSMANMMILAVADLAVLRQRFLTRIAINQSLVGALAIALTAIAAAGLVSSDALVFGSVGWAPVLIMLGYLSGMRLIYLNRVPPPFESRAAIDDPESSIRATEDTSLLRRAVVGFVAAAAVILVAANVLADSAATVADEFGLAQSFVGVTLVALTTSLPEVTVTVTCVRKGAYDMAVGNLLGSNCFNMVILLALDITDGGGSVLARTESSVMITAMFAIVLMAQTLIEVLNRTERRVMLLEPDAVLRIGMYILGLVLIYRLGG